jgi:predicted nuclease of predicted toxin-antitoxin system
LLFLADENMPSNVATVLTVRGHAVRFVQEFGFGLSDEEVLKIAVKLDAVLLTRDQDFGRLIFEMGRQYPAGVVLFRLPSHEIISVVETLDSLPPTNQPLISYFTTWDRHGIRQRKLPSNRETLGLDT